MQDGSQRVALDDVRFTGDCSISTKQT